MSNSSERMNEMRMEKHLLDFARWRLSKTWTGEPSFQNQDGELDQSAEGERFPGETEM